jgi:hypothetical protein
MTRARPAVYLALNGASLMLAGLFAGAAIPAVQYPRLMLTAHIGFTGSGLISMVAAVLLSSSLCSLSARAASVVVWAHVALWPMCLAEVAAAFWGTTRVLRIAGAQAGATGGAPWQETIVTVCHALPALALIVAWTLLVWGVWRVFRNDRADSTGGMA